jgi:hypothetical protein
MKEYAVDKSDTPNTQPTEPHFDDERTLQTARPVVPLEKINTKVRHRRLWILGGAFAVAMMLGAASALLASYLKLRHATPTVAAEVSEEVDAAPAPVAAVESAPVETPQIGPIQNTEEEAPVGVTPKKDTSVRRRTVVARHDSEPVTERDTTRLSEDEQLQRIRQAVLYDEWQERRARRVLRRERRRAERYNHRDLSNLDEIFEGRRRP